MQASKENQYLFEMNLPECIPDKVKVSFFESKKKEWEKVVETSEGGLNEEHQPEYIMHWKKINVDAKERIKEIDEKLRVLKLKLH
jgi:hypothetical protein